MRGGHSQRPSLIRVRARASGPGTCRDCGAPFRWYRTYPEATNVPIDGRPTVLGSSVTAAGDLVIDIVASTLHWRTCPMRRRRRRLR